MAQGVVDQVVEHPFDLQAIQAHPRQVAVHLDPQADRALVGLGGEALLGLAEQFVEVAGRQFELLQAVLVARETQQVVDQPHQAVHLLVDGAQQVGFA
ncbi:hypothetical protein D3C72_2076330 [compost metagenome]